MWKHLEKLRSSHLTFTRLMTQVKLDLGLLVLGVNAAVQELCDMSNPTDSTQLGLTMANQSGFLFIIPSDCCYPSPMFTEVMEDKNIVTCCTELRFLKCHGGRDTRINLTVFEEEENSEQVPLTNAKCMS